MQAETQEHTTQSKAQTQSKAFVTPVPVIQKKLKIGAADDPYEVEADALADKVVYQMSTPPVPPRNNEGSLVQKKCSSCKDEEIRKKGLAEHITPLVQRSALVNQGEAIASNNITQQINSSKGGGSVMDGKTQSLMENGFGSDFSNVRIHTDANAIQLSKSLHAQAFTVGNDIYFNEGKYNPNSNSGKHLLAHELTHTIQQKSINNKNIQRRTRDEALSYGQNLDALYPNWLSVLPNCPCTYSIAMGESSVWRDATHPLTQSYHPGAQYDVRTTQGYSTTSGSHHGQQCTYDSNGDLITEGAGAGTPDIWSPRDGLTNLRSERTQNHQRDDVEPFDLLGWRIYNQYWRPNNGNNCVANAGRGRRASSGRHHIVGIFEGVDLLVLTIPLRTVSESENVLVRETGRTRGGMVGGRGHYSMIEVIPDSPAAETLFGNNAPRFVPDYLLRSI